MSGLKLFFLGSPRIERDEVVLELESRKGLALLAYLAVSGHSHNRDALSTLLWPDSDQAGARSYLRHALWLLKKVLGDGWLDISREQIGLRAEAEVWLDVRAFQQGTAGSQGQELARLAEAVQLYRGDFLSGFTLPDAPNFDEWQFFQTEELRKRLADGLKHLVWGYSQQSHFELALPHARHWVALDPLHEPAQRHLVQLYGQTGQKAAALRQYEEYAALLEKELSLAPEEETTTLYEAIKAQRMVEPFLKAKGQPRPEPAPDSETQSGPRSAVPPPLPWPESLLPAETEETPFVGRQPELARLNTLLEAALSGQNRIAFVVGPAGQGKTALLQAFGRQAQAAHPDLIVVGGNCNAYTGLGDPYLPFREMLDLLTGDIEAQTIAGTLHPERARRLWQAFPLTVQALLERGPALFDTFIPLPGLLRRAGVYAQQRPDWFSQLQTLAAQRSKSSTHLQAQQDALFEQYARVVQTLAGQMPLLLLLDDLQWADPGSISLLFHLGRRLSGQRVLLVGAFRPNEVIPAQGGEPHPLTQVVHKFQSDFGQIILDLSQTEGRTFVDELLDSQPNRLDAYFRQTLYRQTGGHPLFTLELLRGMQERGDLVRDETGVWSTQSSLNWNTLPARVEGAIAERIGRLAPTLQKLLQAASVEGEEFTAEVIAQTLKLDEHEVVGYLSRELDKTHALVRAVGTKRIGQRRLSRYRFRHILIQRYLYKLLDEVESVYQHERVALTLEELYGDQAADVAVQLVRHFEAAGLVAKAVHYLHQAGSRAARLSAQAEAMEHFNRGLTLLGTLPETPERDRQEMALQIALVTSLIVTKGSSALEMEQASNRAWQLYQAASAEGLAQTVENVPQTFQVLYGLFLIKQVRNESLPALELARQMLDIAQRQQDPLLLTPAHWTVGVILFWLGELALAQEHYEQGMALYDPDHHRSHALLFGQDQGTVCLAHQGWNLWQLGYPDQALQRSREAITLAKELAHPYSLLQALIFNAHLCMRRGEWPGIQEHIETEIALCSEHGFIFWQTCPTLHQGKVLVEQGQVEEGIVLIRRFLAAWRGQGAEATVSYLQSILADAYRKAGRAEEGLHVVAEALAAIEKTAEHFWEPELYRLRGELLLKDEGGRMKDEAEKCFWQAVELARRQKARSLELRAVTSLSRLWQSQGKQVEAKQMLAEIYGWFTEGFDTMDLQEAKTLLEAL